MDRLEEINQEYAQWQKELSIREMKLRPSYCIEKEIGFKPSLFFFIKINTI